MKNNAFVLLAGLALATIFGGVAIAQQQPAAPAAVPEQMPFDIPYGTSITLEHAMKVAAAAEAEAKKHNWKMNIAVVGPSGDLVYFQRMDGAQIASVQISQDKAHAAATFRRPTKAFFDAVEGGHVYIAFLHGVVPSEGGFPLVEGGKLIGAIGCSGGTGAQDGVTCKAGADTVK
jgi:uncharacterized protein GlcG (DUF336 family)